MRLPAASAWRVRARLTSQATAIGNSLNVVVVGSHNTTVVDSTQTNNGNQTATAQTQQPLTKMEKGTPLP